MINPNQSQPENLLSSPKSAERKKFTTKQKVGLLMAGISVFGALGTGCSAKSPDVNTPTETSAESAPESTNTAPAAEAGTDQYKDKMEQYKSMDIDSFYKLPKDEQLLYSEYLVDQTVERGNYVKIYNYSMPGEKYMIDPVETSRDNNGQEIVDSSTYRAQISYLQFVEGEEKPYDPIDGQKILASIYKSTDGIVTVSFTEIRDIISTMRETNVDSSTWTATNTSELENGTDSEGNKVEYKDVTFQTEDVKTRYARYIYHEFTNYKGERDSIWLIEAMSTSPDNLKTDSSIR